MSRKADIFESGCEAPINSVNCVGVMGKRLALVLIAPAWN